MNTAKEEQVQSQNGCYSDAYKKNAFPVRALRKYRKWHRRDPRVLVFLCRSFPWFRMAVPSQPTQRFRSDVRSPCGSSACEASILDAAPLAHQPPEGFEQPAVKTATETPSVTKTIKENADR